VNDEQAHRKSGRAVWVLKELRAMETCKKTKKLVANNACFCVNTVDLKNNSTNYRKPF